MNSSFLERLKVSKEKKEKIYEGSNLKFRLDRKTGKIGCYISREKFPKIYSHKPWTISNYSIRDVNIMDHNIIDYTLTVSPSGHFSTAQYCNEDDGKRYGQIYSKKSIGLQLFGDKDFADRNYTLKQLIELADEINRRKDNATYLEVLQVNYNDSYKGKKYLEDLHIIMPLRSKEYKDKDWDKYRNHKVGFVFQSYNLIGHSSILSNVELALTIAGLKKVERKRRALEALEKVGLSEEKAKRRPAQLSGGQMQRVAIARALVNDPEILLADEPTGALDSETSIQIMDLLKEVAKDRLVIMVTHNPDLAEKYATRIIKMKDGELTDDSNPYKGETEKERENVLSKKQFSKGTKEKTSMSFATATALSGKNLLSKLRRTILVALAGSIGIIGVSAVLAVSSGVNGYIGSMQNDMLSSYPLAISEEAVDLSSLLTGLSSWDKKIKFTDLNNQVGVDSMISYLMDKYKDVTQVKKNDINEDLLKFVYGNESNNIACISEEYNIDPTNNIFTTWQKSENEAKQTVSLNGLTQKYVAELNSIQDFSKYAQYVSLFTNFMHQIPGSGAYEDEDFINDQYDCLAGRYPSAANELMFVVDKDTTMTDLILGQLGFFTEKEFINIARKAIEEAKDNPDPEIIKKYQYPDRFHYDDILAKELTYFKHETIYDYGTVYTIDSDQITFKVPGMIEGSLIYNDSADTLTGDVIYQGATLSVTLSRVGSEIPTPKYLGKWTNGEIVFEIKNDGFIKLQDFNIPYSAQTIHKPVTAYYYPSVKKPEWTGVDLHITGIYRLKKDRQFGSLSRGIYFNHKFRDLYISDNKDHDIITNPNTGIEAFLKNPNLEAQKSFKNNCLVTFDYTSFHDDTEVGKPIPFGAASALNLTTADNISSMFSTASTTTEYYHTMDKGYLRSLCGLATKESLAEDGKTTIYSFEKLPSKIQIFPKDFTTKNAIAKYLDQWNADGVIIVDGKPLSKEQRGELTYTDTISVIINVINVLIQSVTIALVAFTSLSLVVSCFMIAVITYISVVERTKEIGVIRSLGGRKKDVSRLFIAETFITGAASGVVGIIVTYILQIILNVVGHQFNIPMLSNLTPTTALIMLTLSVVLSILSGLVPSLKAANSDPVTALRSE